MGTKELVWSCAGNRHRNCETQPRHHRTAARAVTFIISFLAIHVRAVDWRRIRDTSIGVRDIGGAERFLSFVHLQFIACVSAAQFDLPSCIKDGRGFVTGREGLNHRQ